MRSDQLRYFKNLLYATPQRLNARIKTAPSLFFDKKNPPQRKALGEFPRGMGLELVSI
jgi:hypothetical protein